MRRLGGLVLACAAIASPSEAGFRYLRCSFPFTEPISIRLDQLPGFADLHTDQRGSLRRAKASIVGSILTVDEPSTTWRISLKDMKASAQIISGGEGHVSFGECIEHAASEYPAAESFSKIGPREPQPRGSPDTWVTFDDYPARDLRQGHQGTVRYHVRVGPTGRAFDCSITESSGYSSLDDATCISFIRRARFNPALDKEDNPISSSFSGQHVWRLPPE
jgi:TonB family protein